MGCLCVIFNAAILFYCHFANLIFPGAHHCKHLIKAFQASKLFYNFFGIILSVFIQCVKVIRHIKFFEVHAFFSFNQFVQQFDQGIQAVAFELYKFALFYECVQFIKLRVSHNGFNFLQREVQFFEKKDLLESFQRIFIVEAVSGLRQSRRLEQSDFIVELEGAHADSCQVCHLFYCHHIFSPSFLPSGITLGYHYT